MFASLVFLTLTVHASEKSFPLQEAIKKCDEQVRWGYYLQSADVIKKLGGRVDIWSIKDLKGKYKSREECEESKTSLNNSYLAEPCQMFSVGKDIILATVYSAKAKYQFDKERFTYIDVLFKEKNKCENSVVSGGKFKGKDDGSMVISGAGKKAQFVFSGTCEEVEILACEAGKTLADFDHIN